MFPAGRRFIGRAPALERLEECFARGARLVTVWGPGGMGKTRLASHFATAGAHGLAPWFCDLSEVRDRGGIVEALARTFDVPVTTGITRDAIQQLGRAIAHRGRSLVVLDNFEQLTAHAASTVGRWLEQAPQARFLVTSRETLKLQGEITLELPPLSLPASGADALRTEAVELFVERVRATNPEFRIPPGMEESVSEIVSRLEGMPLAIELAAARVPVLGLDGLRTRLVKRLDVLTKGAAGAPPRQATLRGALEWSWDLLSAAEREALAASSVFRGGFDLDAAEAVLGAGAIERLESLREKALLLSSQDPEFPERMRFGSFDTVRELAAEKLEGDARRAAEEKHRAHFRAHAARWKRELESGGSAPALRELGNERQNLLAVVERCLAATPPAVECALEVAVALDPVLAARGPAQHRLELFDAVIAAAKGAPDSLRPLVAASIVARGCANRVRGRAKEAERDFADARSLARRAHATEVEAEAVLENGILLHERRSLDAARAAYEEALLLALGTRTQARALGNVGAVFHDEGRFEEARERYRLALELCVKSGDARLEGLYRFDLAILEQERGDMIEAREQYRRSLERLHTVRDRRLEAIARGSFGTLLQEEGDWAGALALHDEALRALREVGDVRSEGLALSRAGASLAMLGRIAEARDALDEAERLLTGLDDDVALAATAVNRAFADLAAAQEAIVRGDAATRGRHRDAIAARLERARTPAAGGKPAPAAVSDDVRIAARILERAIAAWAAPAAGARLRVGPGAAWFEAPRHRRADLAKHAAARRIFLRLLEERRTSPKRALTLDGLREAGWPGERLSEDAATNRTHVALALLRKKGLKAHLLRGEAGYFLDPDLPVEWAER